MFRNLNTDLNVASTNIDDDSSTQTEHYHSTQRKAIQDDYHQRLVDPSSSLPCRRYIRSTSMEKALGIYNVNFTTNSISTYERSDSPAVGVNCDNEEDVQNEFRYHKSLSNDGFQLEI